MDKKNLSVVVWQKSTIQRTNTDFHWYYWHSEKQEEHDGDMIRGRQVDINLLFNIKLFTMY